MLCRIIASLAHRWQTLTAGGSEACPGCVTPPAAATQLLSASLSLSLSEASLSWQSEPAAALHTRLVAGMCGDTLVLSLPDGQAAATAALGALTTALPHGLKQMRSEPEPHHPNHLPHATPPSRAS
jgi:molybdopterin biosynthesis enzyme MoaB